MLILKHITISLSCIKMSIPIIEVISCPGTLLLSGNCSKKYHQCCNTLLFVFFGVFSAIVEDSFSYGNEAVGVNLLLSSYLS